MLAKRWGAITERLRDTPCSYLKRWLPGLDSNQGHGIQSPVCYHCTTGHRIYCITLFLGQAPQSPNLRRHRLPTPRELRFSHCVYPTYPGCTSRTVDGPPAFDKQIVHWPPPRLFAYLGSRAILAAGESFYREPSVFLDIWDGMGYLSIGTLIPARRTP